MNLILRGMTKQQFVLSVVLTASTACGGSPSPEKSPNERFWEGFNRENAPRRLRPLAADNPRATQSARERSPMAADDPRATQSARERSRSTMTPDHEYVASVDRAILATACDDALRSWAVDNDAHYPFTWFGGAITGERRIGKQRGIPHFITWQAELENMFGGTVIRTVRCEVRGSGSEMEDYRAQIISVSR